MTTLTVSIPANLKKVSKTRAKKDGVTLTFLIQKFLENYNRGKYSLELFEKEEQLKD